MQKAPVIPVTSAVGHAGKIWSTIIYYEDSTKSLKKKTSPSFHKENKSWQYTDIVMTQNNKLSKLWSTGYSKDQKYLQNHEDHQDVDHVHQIQTL